MVTLEDIQKEEIGKNHKLTEVTLIYDQTNTPLEAFYFWLVDFLRDGLKLKVEKIGDYYAASAGSAFFGEMNQRMTILLSKGMDMIKAINAVTKAIMAILNEIKYIESRVKLYDQIKSDNLEEAEVALKALKSIWMDNVDSQRGGASLLNLRSRAGFAAIVDFFMLTEDKEGLERLAKKGIVSKKLLEDYITKDKSGDYKFISSFIEQKIVNKRVGNIVAARLREFYNWIESSEREVKSRYNILRTYLKHEINSLMTYLEFAKPYLRMARRLLIKDFNSPDLVNVFESALIEIDLIASGDEKEIKEWNDDKKDFEKKILVPVYEIQMKLRTIPTAQRVQMSNMYLHIGRIDFTFRSYVLTKEELEEIRINEEIKDLMYVQGITESFLKEISHYIFDIFLFDEIMSNPELRKKVADKLGKKPEEIQRPEDIKWSKDLVEEIKKHNPKLLEGIEWIVRYLPSEDRKSEEKTEENKGEEKKEENIFEDLLDVFHFLLVIPKDVTKAFQVFREEKEYLKRKPEISKAKEEKDKFYDDVKSLALDIYKTFKESFGLLSW